jgi:hypothetical protein
VTPQELAEAYLGALGRGDLDALAGLFTGGAMVYSPLYGPLPPADDRIAALHIVYDTVDVRPIFENETRRPSWHADQSGH